MILDAVKMVMPESKHRIGLWNVCQNASKHLSVYYGQAGFESLFNECISGCHTEEEFESRWSSLLEQFNLHNDPWLNAQCMSLER